LRPSAIRYSAGMWAVPLVAPPSRERRPAWSLGRPSEWAVTLRTCGSARTQPVRPGEMVTWWDERGRRTGRFVAVVTRGRHRGVAEVALGGAIAAERITRVPLERLSPAGWTAPGRARGSS
jgi:hypothetical protein